MIYPGKRSSVPEKNLYSVVVGWNILYLSVRFVLIIYKLEEVVLSSCLYSSWVGLMTCFLDLEGCRMCSAAAQCCWLGFLVWQFWRICLALGGDKALLPCSGGALEWALWPGQPASWRSTSAITINQVPQPDESTKVGSYIYAANFFQTVKWGNRGFFQFGLAVRFLGNIFYDFTCCPVSENFSFLYLSVFVCFFNTGVYI